MYKLKYNLKKWWALASSVPFIHLSYYRQQKIHFWIFNVRFCCSTLICMLVTSFCSSLRRFWFPTGISGRKSGGLGFWTCKGNTLIITKRKNNLPPGYKMWFTKWMTPFVPIISDSGIWSEFTCIVLFAWGEKKDPKMVKMSTCKPQAEQIISDLDFWVNYPFR